MITNLTASITIKKKAVGVYSHFQQYFIYIIADMVNLL